MHCRVFSSIMASTHKVHATTKNVSRQCQASLGENHHSVQSSLFHISADQLLWGSQRNEGLIVCVFECWGEMEGEILIKKFICVCHLWVSPVVKNLPAKARDLGLIPGSGRYPGEGNGNLLQYPCLENSMDRGVWWAMSMGL